MSRRTIADVFKKLVPRVLVVLKAAPAYLVAVSTVITIVLSEIDGPAPVVRYGAIAVAALASAVSIIRRVTPVIESQRGLLPPVGPIVPAEIVKPQP
jgi:hypothetical protein